MFVAIRNIKYQIMSYILINFYPWIYIFEELNKINLAFIYDKNVSNDKMFQIFIENYWALLINKNCFNNVSNFREKIKIMKN